MVWHIVTVIGFMVLYYIIFMVSIFFHELGHKYLLTTYNDHHVKIKFYFKSIRDYGIEVGKKGDYIFLSKPQQLNVYLIGVAVGVIVLLIFAALLNQAMILFLLIPYLFGCRSDIKQIIYILRKEKLEWEY